MTKNRIRYFILVGIANLIWINFGGRTPFLLVSVLVVCPFISYIMCNVMRKKGTIRFAFEKDMIGRGSDQELTVIFDNKLYIPSVGCKVTFDLSNDFYEKVKTITVDIPVKGYGENKITVPLTSGESGYITAGNPRIIIEEMFGILSTKGSYDVSEKYMVMPSMVDVGEVDDIISVSDDSEELLTEKGEDTSEIADIREYIPGDRMQRIHWKLTMKTEEMMVKEYAKNYDIQFCVVLDFAYGPDDNNIDELLDDTYSLLEMLSNDNEQFVFCHINSEHNGLMSHVIRSEVDIIDAFSELYYIRPCEQTGESVAFAKTDNIDNAMYIRWEYAGAENEDDIILRLSERVVLSWE